MRRVHDELYEQLHPAERPTVTALAEAAHVSRSYVSECFSGKRRPALKPFRLMVEALGGNPDEWEPRWHRADAAHPPLVEGGEPVPFLPGIDEEGGGSHESGLADGTARPVAGPDDALRRHPFRRLVRNLIAWVILAFTWHTRIRRDKHAIRLRRKLVKAVRDRTAEHLRPAEVHHYLQPTFVILTERCEDGLARRRGRRARRSAPEARQTPVTSIRALYEDTDDLVILGKPGMGKTTQLARLAHRLAVEVLESTDDQSPPHVPVFLRLDTYRGEPAEDWLVNAMSREYGVSGVLVRTWLSEHRLLPVLDGLDEVPEADRSKCVRELRRLRRVCPGMAVGCRTDEADLRRLAFTLRGRRYVEIQPPSRQDVQNYLAADREALADVHVALEEDPHLWPLLQSPMMLGFIRLAYADRRADDLRSPGTLTERRNRIFDAYVRECLRRERPHPDTAAERTLTWLTWLARTLTDRGEHVLYLDRLDLTWLSRTEQILPRTIPNLAMSVCALGLPVLWVAAAVHAGIVRTSVAGAGALAAAMAITCAVTAYHSEKRAVEAGEEGNEPTRGALAGPVAATSPLMVLMVFVMVYVAHIDLTAPGATVVGLAFVWVAATQMEASLTDVFDPVEQMRWTWRRRERMIYTKAKFHIVRSALTLFVWLAIECLLGYVVHLVCPDPLWVGPAAAAVLGVIYVLGNQFEPSLRDRRPRPNEGMRRTARFALLHGFAGLTVGIVALTALIGLAAPGHDLRRAGYVAVLLGVLFAVVRGFRYGGLAALRHWTIRAVLAYRGRTPYRYRRFLHAAEERVLVHRTDSGFFFPHRLLQLHLAVPVEQLLPRVVPPADEPRT
ncbi:NACHT domain-containing protein [Streptomyces sp. NPDC059720]|uniref:NACHT domain-containing protein n=1 Tax=Streptomyces sp. NPDC059720 TaxID=3346924 RepID=UPI00368701D1